MDIEFFHQQGGRATFHEVAAAIKKSDEWQKCVNLSQQMHVQLLKIFKLVGKLCIVVSLSKDVRPKMQQLLSHVFVFIGFCFLCFLFFTPPPECGVDCSAKGTFAPTAAHWRSCSGGIYCLFGCAPQASTGGRWTSLYARDATAPQTP